MLKKGGSKAINSNGVIKKLKGQKNRGRRNLEEVEERKKERKKER